LRWRAAFFIESAAILPFVVFAFVSKPLHLTGSRETRPGGLRVYVYTEVMLRGIRYVGVTLDAQMCVGGCDASFSIHLFKFERSCSTIAAATAAVADLSIYAFKHRTGTLCKHC
jgi:hypothetical protein